ncbi:hypothetical protein Ancab_025370 [Ancistrocladus abbreviatus]
MKARLSFLFIFFFFLSLLHLLSSYTHNEGEEGDDDISRSMFPDDFFFGISTSAYQIEGAVHEDGRGLSNWDVFTRIRGTVTNGDNADIADDDYHRYMEDIELLEYLGVNAYRLSISWARILPKGRFGEVNLGGIRFYNKLIDNILLKGIVPFVTLDQNDIPQEIEDRYGSWLSPLIREDFALLAKTCFENFGDRVKHWITISEPNLLAEMTYLVGWYPPARCSPPFGNCSAGNSDTEPFIAAHNMLLAHATAVKLYREQFQSKQGGSIGIVVHSFWFEPYQDNEFDREAVNRALIYDTAWTLDPLMYGDYPALMRQYIGSTLPSFSPEETKLIKGSVDFIGINHYSTFYAINCFHAPCSIAANRPSRGYIDVTGFKDGIPIGERTGMPMFFVVPHGMEKILEYASGRYPNVPIFVFENGISSNSTQDHDDEHDIVQDFERIKFHKSYLAALAKAMSVAVFWGSINYNMGVPLNGLVLIVESVKSALLHWAIFCHL